MKNVIHIDIGGTFTDCFIYTSHRTVSVKGTTKPYNLTESILGVIEDCAVQLGTDLHGLVNDATEIRYSTTIALNQLLLRKGPRLALLATAGAEDALYIGLGAQWKDGLSFNRKQNNLPAAQKPVPLIPRELCLTVRERLDYRGSVIRALDEEHLINQLMTLENKEVQGIVVALLWSFLNPVHEQSIKRIILEEFRHSYLSSIPIILSSEMIPSRGEYQRTMTAVLNAYLQPIMDKELNATINNLRQYGFKGAFLMVTNNGGLADVSKTTPLATFNGGPVSGMRGGLSVGDYGDKIITTDMGGTTFDIGVIAKDESLPYKFKPVVDRWLIATNMLDVTSISGGGGTIVRVNKELDNKLEFGPESTGAVPGPAAYDLGGMEATITDADLVLGYLNAHSFNGGRKQLNTERAGRIINERVAKPLGLSVIEAAKRIRTVFNQLIGQMIFKMTVNRGYDPREFTLLVYGGAGPTHCCDYAKVIDPVRIVAFPHASVFSAFSSMFLQQTYTYLHSKPFVLMHPQSKTYTDEFFEFNQIVEQLQEKAYQDLQSLLKNKQIHFLLELDVKFGGQVHVKRIISPLLFLQVPADLEAIYNTFVQAYSKHFSPLSLYPEGGVIVENFILQAQLPDASFRLPTYSLSTSSSARSLVGRRDVFWIDEQNSISTPIYSYALLQAGNVVEGPAIIEDSNTTYVIPRGKRFSLDKYLVGIIE